MIKYKKTSLANGLTVIIHEDTSTPFATVNVLYRVGSRNENPEKTGFAHLFEHLMFGGSENVVDFDGELQRAGGDSNAFTNSDITNYFDTIPASNVETALWIESDRMLQLDFNQKSLDVQKSVVVEEFKENYINQPYGNVWHNILKLAYKKHPYRWPTIGIEPKHVEDASLKDVESFFYKHYRPNNAILVVAGNVDYDSTIRLIEKWFGEIPSGDNISQNFPFESEQTEERSLSLFEDVPVSAIFKSYHMGARKDNDFYASDILTDVLSSGKSARLKQELVKKRQVFSSVNAYITESIDPGLIIIEGRLNPGMTMEKADQELSDVIYSFVDKVSDEELLKTKNKIESNISFSKVELLTRAMNLAYYEMIGDIDLINTEEKKYRGVTMKELRAAGKKLLKPENCSTLYYNAK